MHKIWDSLPILMHFQILLVLNTLVSNKEVHSIFFNIHILARRLWVTVCDTVTWIECRKVCFWKEWLWAASFDICRFPWFDKFPPFPRFLEPQTKTVHKATNQSVSANRPKSSSAEKQTFILQFFTRTLFAISLCDCI